MNREFWAARWQQQRIGFHMSEVNPSLLAYVDRWLDVPDWDVPKPLQGRRILVPLCGKTLDMRWLADHGAEVTGVEFVERAALAFFEEQALPFVERSLSYGKELLCTTDGLSLRIVVADFFALESTAVGTYDAIYDRAGLIAVVPDVRAQYAARIASLCTTGASLLLVTLEHDAIGGPPFTLPKHETRSLLVETFDVTLLREANQILSEPQFAQRGATYFHEQIWLGCRRSTGTPIAQ